MDQRLHYGDGDKNKDRPSGDGSPYATLCGRDDAKFVTYRPYELLDDPPPAYVTQKRCEECRKILRARQEEGSRELAAKAREALLKHLAGIQEAVRDGRLSFVAWIAVGNEESRNGFAGVNVDPVYALGLVSVLKGRLHEAAADASADSSGEDDD